MTFYLSVQAPEEYFPTHNTLIKVGTQWKWV